MKSFYCFLIFISIGLHGLAQEGNNGVNISAEAGFPTGNFSNYKTGYGAFLKGLLGVGDHAQITLMSGYSSFLRKGSTDAIKTKTSIIPVLLGYKYHFLMFYMEPQAGYGSFRSKVKLDIGGSETTTSSNRGAFTWAVGAGVDISNLELGLRYQSGHYGGTSIGYFGIHVGVNLDNRGD